MKYIIIILIILTMSLYPVESKAGGILSTNITNITLDASQSPPTCGRASPCHDETLNDFGADVNISVVASIYGEIDIPQDIAVLVSVNESVDEIGCIFMSLSAPDGSTFWAEGVGVEVIEVNATGTSVNWYQSTGSLLSFNYTIVSRTNGLKELMVACGGGLSTAGQQDWALNYTFDIDVNGQDKIILTISDLNLNSIDIPIINKIFVSENKISIFENNVFLETTTTNGQLFLKPTSNYSIKFKPSKSQTLTNWNAFINLLSTYYQVVISLLVVFILIVLIKKK